MFDLKRKHPMFQYPFYFFIFLSTHTSTNSAISTLQTVFFRLCKPKTHFQYNVGILGSLLFFLFYALVTGVRFIWIPLLYLIEELLNQCHCELSISMEFKHLWNATQVDCILFDEFMNFDKLFKYRLIVSQAVYCMHRSRACFELQVNPAHI